MTTATGILGTAPVGLDFIFAGQAIFTVSNPTGRSYTYRVSLKKGEPGTRFAGEAWFVGLLTGPQNTGDYTYLGKLDRATGAVRLTRASAYPEDAVPVMVVRWALKLMLAGATLPSGYEVRHAGRCGRCGRVLTVPESIDSGIGPVCAGRT
jgi:hypothetical protein